MKKFVFSQLIIFAGEAEQGYHVRLQRRSHGPADVLRSSQVIFHPNIVQTVFEIASVVAVWKYALDLTMRFFHPVFR
jgi:hypothetical protein